MIDDDRQDDPAPEGDAPLEDAEPTAAPDEAPAEPGDTAPDVTEGSGEGGGQFGGAREEDVAGDEASQPADAIPSVDDLPAPDSASDDEPAPAAEAEAPADEPAAEQQRAPKAREKKADEPEVIPGAHLEPDLVLEQPAAEGDEYAQYAEPAEGEDAEEADGDAEPAVAVRSPLDLAADARYQATGKRKTAIARVVVKPGNGTYTINGRTLEEFFPRIRLQKAARQPLEATGNHQRMDVVARIHGGGVASQAGALRHGIARALVDASPELRTELKRRGYLTRDPREKERKKAGLKKARKRPQFSKR